MLHKYEWFHANGDIHFCHRLHSPEVDAGSEVGVQDFLLWINTTERKGEDQMGQKNSHCDVGLRSLGQLDREFLEQAVYWSVLHHQENWAFISPPC